MKDGEQKCDACGKIGTSMFPTLIPMRLAVCLNQLIHHGFSKYLGGRNYQNYLQPFVFGYRLNFIILDILIITQNTIFDLPILFKFFFLPYLRPS